MSKFIEEFLLVILFTILIPAYILIKLGEIIINLLLDVFESIFEVVSDFTDDMILFWKKVFKIME